MSDDRPGCAPLDIRAGRILADVGDYISPELAALAVRAVELEARELEPSSQRTYRYLSRDFETFCDRHGLDPFATSSVRLYVAQRVDAGEPKTTLRNRLIAIRHLARAADRPDPTADPHFQKAVGAALKALPPREPRRATPATYDIIERLAAALEVPARREPLGNRKADLSALYLRDRALVLLGFALGRRGAELARVDVEHLARKSGGVLIKIPYTKTNKSGEPEYVGVPAFPGDPLCPVAALDAWLTYARIASGPVFTTLSPVSGKGGRRIAGIDISRRLKTVAEHAGLPGFWSSHSLRRGVVTSAERAGVARSRTRTLTGWKSDAMFVVYADHVDKIDASPLHEIYARSDAGRSPGG